MAPISRGARRAAPHSLGGRDGDGCSATLPAAARSPPAARRRADTPAPRAARAAAVAALAVLALLASPAAAGGGSKGTCTSNGDCMMPAIWDEWTLKFNTTIFGAADGGWSKAMEYYLNPAKIEHWLDEYHVQAGCCEFWRCNNATLRCEPPASGALGRAAPLALLLAVVMALLL
jgi:hypothetical protein